MANYTYTSSIDYINNLAFDYIETYSLQRGEEYEEIKRITKPEYDKLKVRKNKTNNLTKQEEERFLELHSLLGFTQYLINEKGEFHPSSKKINTFQAKDDQVDKLKKILQTEIKEVPSWMCAPKYRDALVFYDNTGQILSILNICLGCEYMETKMFHHINADIETYKLLKQFFKDIGHKIE